MVGTSLRHAGEELLGQRGGLPAYRERGSTFGIPLLHPWANRLGRWSFDLAGRPVRLEGARGARADEHGLPIHGLLAAAPDWQVLDAGEHRLGAAFEFSEPELRDAFPFEHRLELEVRLDPGVLTVTTAVVAGGDARVPLAFGFHPYLRIPGLERERWEVRLPVRRRLVVDERGLPTGAVEDVEPYAGPIGGRAWETATTGWCPASRSSWPARGGGSRSTSARASRSPRCSRRPARSWSASSRWPRPRTRWSSATACAPSRRGSARPRGSRCASAADRLRAADGRLRGGELGAR
jgi:hypothetical protein